LQNKVKLIIEL